MPSRRIEEQDMIKPSVAASKSPDNQRKPFSGGYIASIRWHSASIETLISLDQVGRRGVGVLKYVL